METERTEEKQDEYDSELIDGVSDDVLHHCSRNESLRAAVWFAVEKRIGWQLGGERQRGQRIHYKVHPQHLYCFQR